MSFNQVSILREGANALSDIKQSSSSSFEDEPNAEKTSLPVEDNLTCK